MTNLNCWQFKKCGREPGGAHEADLGICPASTETRLNGAHGGTNAGRACWVVAGTLCGGKVTGSFAEKLQNCETCDFYHDVQLKAGSSFQNSIHLFKLLGR